MRQIDSASRPELAIAAQIAAADPGARRAPVEDIVADAIGARAAFTVESDGVVRIAFGGADAGHPTIPLVPTKIQNPVETLDARAVGAFLVHASELRQQLGVDLGELDFDRVAEILRERALARRAELARNAANCRVEQRVATADELARTERRAVLLRELSTLDGEASGLEAQSPRRAWWSR